MGTSEALLALLEPEPAYGYSLKHRYDRWFAQSRPLAFGQVYATLSRLERKGWATKGDPEAGQGPDRRLYEITADGVTAVDEWVSTPQPADLFATSSLHARLTAALLSGRDTAGLLAGQRDVYMHRMRELSAARREATGADLLAVTYELAHLDADLRWIEESGQRMDALRAQIGGEPS